VHRFAVVVCLSGLASVVGHSVDTCSMICRVRSWLTRWLPPALLPV
jgi:hypothetical protein